MKYKEFVKLQEAVDHNFFDAVVKRIKELRPNFDLNVHYSQGSVASVGLGNQMKAKTEILPATTPEEAAEIAIQEIEKVVGSNYQPPDYAATNQQYKDLEQNPNSPYYKNWNR